MQFVKADSSWSLPSKWGEIGQGGPHSEGKLQPLSAFTNCIQLTVSFTLMFLYYGTDHYFLWKTVSPHEVDTLITTRLQLLAEIWICLIDRNAFH